MTFILQNSLPALQISNQRFAVPATYTNRWRTKNEPINASTVLTDDGSAGDFDHFISPSNSNLLKFTQVYSVYRIFSWNWRLPSSSERQIRTENLSLMPNMLPQSTTLYIHCFKQCTWVWLVVCFGCLNIFPKSGTHREPAELHNGRTD